MKTKFNNSDLCHVFAQRSQNNGTGSNLFFEGARMYSYGHHFLLAEFLNDSTILINDKSYSSSTAKHQSLIRQATRQYKQYFTKSVDVSLVYNQITDLSKRIITARKKDIIASEIISLFESCKEFNSEFRVNDLLSDKFKEIETIYNEISINKDEYIKAAQLRAAKEIENLKAKLKVDLSKFMNYEINSIDSKKLNIDFIRVSSDRENIETSQGVKIPLNDAKELYKMIVAKQDIKGLLIDGYKITGLNGVLSVGCHRIDVENMHLVGNSIIQ